MYRIVRKLIDLIKHSFSNNGNRSFKDKLLNSEAFDKHEILCNVDGVHITDTVSMLYLKAARNKEPLRQITNSFDPIIYDDSSILSALKECQLCNVPIELIITNGPEFYSNNSQFAHAIKNYKNAKLIVTTELLKHMIIVGDQGRSYRYEVDDSSHTSRISFNWPIVGSELLEYFDNKFRELEKSK